MKLGQRKQGKRQVAANASSQPFFDSFGCSRDEKGLARSSEESGSRQGLFFSCQELDLIVEGDRGRFKGLADAQWDRRPAAKAQAFEL